jgi:hypothetical protein
MKRIAFLGTLIVPSIALAHPGHEHAGSANHHLLEWGAIAAVAVGAFFVARVVRNKNK